MEIVKKMRLAVGYHQAYENIVNDAKYLLNEIEKLDERMLIDLKELARTGNKLEMAKLEAMMWRVSNLRYRLNHTDFETFKNNFDEVKNCILDETPEEKIPELEANLTKICQPMELMLIGFEHELKRTKGNFKRFHDQTFGTKIKSTRKARCLPLTTLTKKNFQAFKTENMKEIIEAINAAKSKKRKSRVKPMIFD